MREPRWRAVLVAATGPGAITISLAAIVFDRVLWPFSNYPMYSSLAGPTTAITRVIAVGNDGREPRASGRRAAQRAPAAPRDRSCPSGRRRLGTPPAYRRGDGQRVRTTAWGR